MATEVNPAGGGGDLPAEQRLRDELTIERLVHAVDGWPELEVIGFEPQWWDGQAYGPCLVVRFGNSRTRRRVLETGGDAVVLPFRRRRAGRELAARRASRRPEIGLPPPRTPADDLVVDVTDDAVRCGAAGCGVMRPLGADGPCPRCGRQ